MRIMRLLPALALKLIRRPWLPTAFAVVPFFVSTIAFAVLFGNLCWANCRFMPELSDEAIIHVGQIQELSAKISVFCGGLLVLSPIVLVYFKKFRAVVALLVWGVCGFLFMEIIKSSVPFIIRFAVVEQIRTARVNLEERADSERLGIPWKRRPIFRYEQHRWLFGNDRYVIRKTSDVGKAYELWDERSRPNQRAKGEWDGLRLLKGVARWHEDGTRLFVMTETGTWHFLDYETGEIKEIK
ncbi:MAG: hypothetical protein IKC14_09265 [Kiritimatiellae bacterium]|nr:hypothetical protein [Kiritimatiellia bacterium]